jgi:hypothetical protein
MSLMINSTPSRLSPVVANNLGVTETQALARWIAQGVHSGATKQLTSGTSSSQSMTVEPDHQQYGDRRRGVQLVDLI